MNNRIGFVVESDNSEHLDKLTSLLKETCTEMLVKPHQYRGYSSDIEEKVSFEFERNEDGLVVSTEADPHVLITNKMAMAKNKVVGFIKNYSEQQGLTLCKRANVLPLTYIIK